MDDEHDHMQRLMKSGKVRFLPQQASAEFDDPKAHETSHRYSEDLSALDPDASQWWVKVVGMSQQNWALPLVSRSGARVLFVSDTSGIFDHIDFSDPAEMTAALIRNGFREYDSSPDFKKFLSPPDLPLKPDQHPNGPIYSSGRYWDV